MNSRNTGFTLVEILVASTIGTFISLIAVGTLHSVITASDMVQKNINAASEVRFAANLLERDLANYYNVDDFNDTEFYGTVENYSDYETADLIFYTVNKAKARIYEPEGDIYEVEYYLEPDDDGTLSLRRRVWPNPNDEYDPGGILTTVAENILYFEVSYYDGEEWYADWPEDMEGPPDLVEVSVTTKPVGLGNPISQTFLVNLVKQVNVEASTVE
jgi:type II secretion system protein J